MEKSKSNGKNGELSDRAVALGAGGMLIGGFAFLTYGATLYILAFLVTFGTLTFGIFLIIRSYSSGDKERQAVEAEIEALARDASFDVSEQIIVWDKLILTKGVGTPLEGREEEVSQIHRRLINARQEIAVAESPQHRLEAVLSADAILATARSLR